MDGMTLLEVVNEVARRGYSLSRNAAYNLISHKDRSSGLKRRVIDPAPHLVRQGVGSHLPSLFAPSLVEALCDYCRERDERARLKSQNPKRRTRDGTGLTQAQPSHVVEDRMRELRTRWPDWRECLDRMCAVLSGMNHEAQRQRFDRKDGAA